MRTRSAEPDGRGAATSTAVRVRVQHPEGTDVFSVSPLCTLHELHALALALHASASGRILAGHPPRELDDEGWVTMVRNGQGRVLLSAATPVAVDAAPALPAAGREEIRLGRVRLGPRRRYLSTARDASVCGCVRVCSRFCGAVARAFVCVCVLVSVHVLALKAPPSTSYLLISQTQSGRQDGRRKGWRSARSSRTRTRSASLPS